MRKKHTPKESLDLPLGIHPSLDESNKPELRRIQEQAASTANEFENDPLIQKALGIFKREIERGLRPTRRSTDQTSGHKDAGLQNKTSGVEARAGRRDCPAAKEEVPSGYEAPHWEWLYQGGKGFRSRFGLDAQEAFYRTQYWRLVSQATLQRDGFTCFRCGEQASQVHHLHYRFMWEDHLHPEALVSVCYVCHGLVEYARQAEALAPIIRRRIYSCQGFVDGTPCSERGNPVRVFSRLLEYRARLAELKRLYVTNVHYTNRPTTAANQKEKAHIAPGVPSGLQGILHSPLDARDGEFDLSAKGEMDSWTGSEREKAARIIPLLEQEIQNCLEFASRVVQPLAKCTCDSKPPRASAAPGGLRPAYGDLRGEGVAEQSASPLNGGLPASLGNSGVKEGPSSVS